MFRMKISALAGPFLLAWALVACSPSPTTTSTASAPPANVGYSVSAYENAKIERDGDNLTATRTGAGQQGIGLISRGNLPVLLTLTASGDSPRVKLHQGDDWIWLPPSRTYSIFLGEGGAVSAKVFTMEGQTVHAHIDSVVSCTQSGVTCQRAQKPSPQ